MGRRFDEWCRSDAERKLRADAAKAPPRAALVYYAVCTVITVAVLTVLGVYVFHPFTVWMFDTYGEWAQLFAPVVLVVGGACAWFIERAKSRRA